MLGSMLAHHSAVLSVILALGLVNVVQGDGKSTHKQAHTNIDATHIGVIDAGTKRDSRRNNTNTSFGRTLITHTRDSSDWRGARKGSHHPLSLHIYTHYDTGKELCTHHGKDTACDFALLLLWLLEREDLKVELEVVYIYVHTCTYA